MLLSIFLIFCTFICGIILFFLLSPIKVSCSWFYKELLPVNYILHFSWLHPLFFAGSIDATKQSFDIVLGGFYKIFPNAGKKEFKDKPRDVKKTKGDKRDSPVIDNKEKPSEKVFSNPQKKTMEHSAKVKPDARDTTKQKSSKKDSLPPKKKKFFWPINVIPLKKNSLFLLNFNWQGKVLRWLKRSIFRFFRILSIPRLEIRLKAGSDDPSQTGVWYGYYIAAVYMLANINTKKRQIMYEPVFNGEPLETSGEVCVRTCMGRLCLPVFMALLTFPYVDTLILFLRARKIGRDAHKKKDLLEKPVSP